MFISLSKTLSKFCGFRLGVGLRITKKNAIWMCFLVMMIQLMKAMWYLMVICGWLCYVVCYAIYKGIRKLIQMIIENKKRGNQA